MQVTSNPLLFSINGFSVADGIGRLWGWIADPDQPFDTYSVILNGVLWVEDQPLEARQDVRNGRFPYVEHTERSGLRVEQPLGDVPVNGPSFEARIVVKYQGEEQGAVTTSLRDLTHEAERLPVPPVDLAVHVGQFGNVDSILYDGWRIYQDLKRGVEQYRPLAEMRRILDWGCGVGRVARFLIEDVPAAHVYGCDIDAETIAWFQVNIPGPTVIVSPPMPPTPYEDAFFDLIFGISIFTHFDEPTQFAWLAELARITAPDGLVAVTVLGRANAHPAAGAVLDAAGFYDERSEQSEIFTPYGGADYYRETYHSRAYIEQQWSKYFEVLEFREFGMNSHQHLVIMRSKQA
ncbi:MAG TPA: class I SAM-dependent methyltransferase [Ktedonobacterales bacterium]|jgi:SAM-dependent methyltransferase